MLTLFSTKSRGTDYVEDNCMAYSHIHFTCEMDVGLGCAVIFDTLSLRGYNAGHCLPVLGSWCVRKAIHDKGGPIHKGASTTHPRGKGAYKCEGNWHGKKKPGDCFPGCGGAGLECQGGSAKPGHKGYNAGYCKKVSGNVPDPGTSIKVSATHSACLFVGGAITTSLCPGTDSGGYPVLNVAECKSCWHKICRKADGSYAADAKDCATTGPPKVVRDVWNGVHHGVPPGCSYRIHDLPAGGGYPLQKMGTKTFNRDLKSVGTRGDLTQVCKVKLAKKPKHLGATPHAAEPPAANATATPSAAEPPAANATATPSAAEPPSANATATPSAAEPPAANATATPSAAEPPAANATATPSAAEPPNATATPSAAETPAPAGKCPKGFRQIHTHTWGRGITPNGALHGVSPETCAEKCRAEWKCKVFEVLPGKKICKMDSNPCADHGGTGKCGEAEKGWVYCLRAPCTWKARNVGTQMVSVC